MARIDVLISNNRHHVSMMAPVVQQLVQDATYQVRILSLCEFRGMETPTAVWQMPGVTLHKLLPFRFRSPSAGGQQGGPGKPSFKRRLIRGLSWHTLLKRPLQTLFKSKPDLLLLPNDAAFPYDRIVTLLHKQKIPFLLVQEGIRFPLPHSQAGLGMYGGGGATAVAAWGQNSARYFEQAGVPTERIHLTGNPRFDTIRQQDWQQAAQELAPQLALGKKHLLFLSNPIDDLGFCSHSQKMDLIYRFIDELTPLFAQSGFRLWIKLHGRESLADFKLLVAGFPFAAQISVLQAEPLYPLFHLADAAVILASTVGLEALLFDLPLGVLEIPTVGFVFDYVSSGVALGLNWQRPLAQQISLLLNPAPTPPHLIQHYLQQQFAVQDQATQQIVDLVKSLIK